MPTRALVLGGGGPIGIAWETGLVAGLAENGVQLAEADLIVGTSAGSMVGSQLALGRRPESMLASQRAMGDRQVGGGSSPSGAQPAAPDLAPLMEMMQRAASGGDPEEIRREIGAFSLKAKTAMDERQWLATFGFLNNAAWPERRFIATAVDAETGAFVGWERDSGTELVRAVASSCTVPGIFPPVEINGRRYIDGGMRSATNADLAKGYERVVVVSVTSGAGQAEMAERSRAAVEAELETLRNAGAQVELIVPDTGATAAFGPNLMDGSRRAAVVEEGYRQGQAEAERLRPFWG